MKMQLSCGCCRQLRAVTIKGIDKTDGTTVWEYGPGAYWRHHYGLDAISGVVPNLAATLNKYAIAAGSFPSYAACGNRNLGTLAANCAEALTITKLNSLDGTVIESGTLTGFFCDVIGTSFVGLMSGLTITNAAALSGGDYVIVGQRLPFIEFVDYSDNTVNKEYILHAHGQQSGNVYLKTRTSTETITIPQNATALEVEALFEATSDCVAATATGGPWPLVPIAIDVEWSVSSGDIASISATDSYSDTGGGDVDYVAVNGDGPPGLRYLEVTFSPMNTGAIFEFEFVGFGDAVFSYTSLTDDPATFTAALGVAMAAFATAQDPSSAWNTVSTDLPGSISVSGNVITITYGSAFADLGVTLTDVGDTTSDSRRAGSCAAAYDTDTGGMTSAVGYEFGMAVDRSQVKMFSETDAIPTVTGLAVLGILAIGSGPSNSLVITPQLRNSGDGVKSNCVEAWTIAAGVWGSDWILYCNAGLGMPPIIPCESGYVICPINAKRFDGTTDRTAARIAVSDATVVELDTAYGSITAPDNRVSTVMYDNTAGSYLSWGYTIMYQDPYRPNNRFRANDDGSDTYVNGDLLRLGSDAFGCDGTSVFSTYTANVTSFRYVPEAVMEHDFVIRFFPNHTARAAEPQQFRFVFDDMPGTNYTAWLDWYSTESEIETALNTLLGSGNCDILDFGLDITPIENNPVAVIEMPIWIQFLTDDGFSPGSGYIPAEYLSTTVGRVRIEVQTLTPFADPPGIAAFSATNGTLVWSRAFGTSGATTIAQPLHAWLEGDFVYAYGNVVDAEL